MYDDSQEWESLLILSLLQVVRSTKTDQVREVYVSTVKTWKRRERLEVVKEGLENESITVTKNKVTSLFPLPSSYKGARVMVWIGGQS